MENPIEQFIDISRFWLGHEPHVIRFPLSHTLFGVDDPQHVRDFRAHHRLGQFAECRDELRAVRRFGTAQVVGDLVQHDEFS